MIAAAQKLGYEPEDDNAADAIHLLLYVIEQFSASLTGKQSSTITEIPDWL